MAVLRLGKTILLSLLPTLLGLPAHGTTVVQLSLEEMLTLSDRVVRGTVRDVESSFSEDGKTIVTYVTLVDVHTIHGIHEGPELTLVFEGGAVGDLEVRVSGQPQFQPGGEELLFLATEGSGKDWIVGLLQGRFRIIAGRVYDDAARPVAVRNGGLVRSEPSLQPMNTPGISIGDLETGLAFVPGSEDYVIPTESQRLPAPQRRNGAPTKEGPVPATVVGPPAEAEARTQQRPLGSPESESQRSLAHDIPLAVAMPVDEFVAALHALEGAQR